MTRLEVVDNDADVVHPLDRHVPEPSGRRWRHRCPYIRLDGELPAGSPAPGGDEWYWHRVVPALRERGHDAVSVALPAADETAGWSEYADVIAALTLVAQSLCGFSAPLACARKAVDQIVLLNAMIPKPREPEA
jgi:hypothetical protein